MSGDRAGDYVKFNLQGLDNLSAKLSSVAGKLESSLPRIKQVISAEGGHLSGDPADYTRNARDDANDMAYRARKAHEADRGSKNYNPLLSNGQKTISLNWDETSKGGRQAIQDATDIINAAKNGDKTISRRDLKAAARSLRDHLGDEAYQKAFWKQIGETDPALPSKLARILHQQGTDGKKLLKPGQEPLDAEAKQIMKDFSRAFATASKAGHFPKTGINPYTGQKDARNPIQHFTVHPPKDDMWSSAMLFKFGPPGKNQYDPKLLTDASKSTLDWRERENAKDKAYYDGLRKHPDSRPEVPDTWKTSLGLSPYDDVSRLTSSKDRQREARLWAEYDPTSSILARTGESKKASLDLAIDSKYAKLLVAKSWQVPVHDGKPIDISKPAASVLLAATSDRSAPGSAKAAFNIFTSVPSVKAGDKSDRLPSELTNALGALGTEYMDVLAASAMNSGQPGFDEKKNKLGLNDQNVRTFLAVIAKEPAVLGLFRGGVEREARKNYRSLLTQDNAPRIDSIGMLSGFTEQAAAHERYGEAEKKDLEAARRLALLDATIGAATGIPLGKMDPKVQKAVDWSKFTVSQGGRHTKNLFDTKHATRVASENEERYLDSLDKSRVPLAQIILELEKEGKIHLEGKSQLPKSLRDSSGRLNITSANEWEFNDWFDRKLPEKYTKYQSDFKNAFLGYVSVKKN